MKKLLLTTLTCLSCNFLSAGVKCNEYKESHRKYLHHLISQSEELLVHFDSFDNDNSELARFYISGKLMAYYESLFFLEEIPTED